MYNVHQISPNKNRNHNINDKGKAADKPNCWCTTLWLTIVI